MAEHAITIEGVARFIGACLLVSALCTFIFWLVVRKER